jgi:hypothetical protein
MKKGIIAIAFVVVLLSLFYFLRPNRTVIFSERSSDGLLKEMLADTSTFEVYDEEGKLIFTRRDTASESIELVNSSLNGDVFYRLAKGVGSGYKKMEVFKYDHKKEHFSVSFNSDTTSGSAPFEARVYLNTIESESATVSVNNEEAYTSEQEKVKYGIRYVYRAKAPKKGINTFKAIIKLQNKTYPIQFNYIVK